MAAEIAEDLLDYRPPGEELVNALTHGVGCALAIYGAMAIFRVSPSPSKSAAVAWWVYSATLIVMYAVSALHHAVREPQFKHVLRILDQGVIYLLIAGTFTPLMWAYLPPSIRWLGLAMVWIPAFAGKYLKVIAQKQIHDFSSFTYLLLGWLPAMLMIAYLPRPCFAWLLLGGVIYSLGTVFLMRDRHVRYFHPLWHLFVMLASACHYYTIYKYALLP